MEDSFIIGAYWDSRAEPLHEVGDKVLQTLLRLSTEDEQFLNWYELGWSKKQALDKKIAFNIETIERLCLSRVKKKEFDDNGYSEMGFLFRLWTGHKEGEASTISFSVGTASEWLTNSCYVKIPSKGLARERLLQIGKAKEIISILADIWCPDYAVLTSDDLRERLNVGNKIGWVTYIKKINYIPQLGHGILYGGNQNGHWFYPRNPQYNDEFEKELVLLSKVI
jgi:hypothetical protein